MSKPVKPKQLMLTSHFPSVHWLEIYPSGRLSTEPSVTLLPMIIMLVSRYVNSMLFISYHGFFWQTSLRAFSPSLFYINGMNQNGIH